MKTQARRAKPDDAEALTVLAHQSKQHWGYSDEFMALWRSELTLRPAFIETNHVVVLENDGRAVGVYALSFEDDECELEHFWIHPDAMGQGLGREMLGCAIQRARSEGAHSIKIVSDPNAAGFYSRMGAVKVGQVASRPPGRWLPVFRLDV